MTIRVVGGRMRALLLAVLLAFVPTASAWWWEDDGRVAFYSYWHESSPAWGPFVEEVVPDRAYADVVIVSECSGPTEMMLVREAHLAIVARGFCDEEIPVPDVAGGERYQLVAAVWGLCQPECLGQVGIELRGVPAP